MLGTLIVLLVTVPLVELFLLLEIAKLVGTWETVALVVATGIGGGYLARHQGLRVLYRVQKKLAQGRRPSAEVADGALVLVGGILLLTPGLLTDLTGFLLLLPFTRPRIRRLLLSRLKDRGGRVEVRSWQGGR